MTKTGMTTISIRTTAVNRRSRSASAMGPLGLRIGAWLKLAAAAQQGRTKGYRRSI